MDRAFSFLDHQPPLLRHPHANPNTSNPPTNSNPHHPPSHLLHPLSRHTMQFNIHSLVSPHQPPPNTNTNINTNTNTTNNTTPTNNNSNASTPSAQPLLATATAAAAAAAAAQHPNAHQQHFTQTMSSAIIPANVVDQHPQPHSPSTFVNSHSNHPLNSTPYPWETTPSSNPVAAHAPNPHHPHPHQHVMPMHTHFTSANHPSAPLQPPFAHALNASSALTPLPTSMHPNLVTGMVNSSNALLASRINNPAFTVQHPLSHASNPLKKPRAPLAAAAAPAHTPVTSAATVTVTATTTATSTTPTSSHTTRFGTNYGSTNNNTYRHRFNAKACSAPTAPLTSPVSTATLPNLKCSALCTPQAAEAAAIFKPNVRSAEDISPPNASAVSAVKPTLANSIMWHASPSPPIASSTGAIATSAAAGAYVSPKSVSNVGRSKRRRKSSNGPPIPVHLRNPKKGRARVFRECKQCATENHIRRSVCVSCRAALPPGKRRREANPIFERRASSSNANSEAAGAVHELGHNKPPHTSGAMQVVAAPETLPVVNK